MFNTDQYIGFGFWDLGSNDHRLFILVSNKDQGALVEALLEGLGRGGRQKLTFHHSATLSILGVVGLGSDNNSLSSHFSFYV